ncbi:HU family DNA-binding protein [Gluconobacter wancherniae]|uniref:DNA-binding protein HU-beta n=1 Tax=Gluconobacter wancherniae NBRC 103581 TaxID=656744 RepID=A0A511B4C4_9PROT|nr:HU family DNA-binding protein [Gluconobacter wancherniae]MBF0854534.1 HU family DNA-binding protein [Gluconobacter wancherniae]MBS1062942.1 HU family DNA-binding protein [Gluconobacter wancherniae]MBS1089639.1 HU family DNA-binding protein [Gluconobacter wancherniae]MBS1095721.1 HU family DNA-binding protein [Gluconobacter wancherniae]GBD57741.1 DNA-binding protein HU-beta [Gluconobacter wancherniae NBRC 103581]
MSKAFLAAVLQDSLDCTGVAAHKAVKDLMSAIVEELKEEGSFTLPSFGTFAVCETKERQALNPRTGATVTVQAGQTVRFKASPRLKQKL